ncbi:group II intron maturase-specific domain-containing protein [Thiohalophilus sp.]|uniref:group II intron maturase-specific domain-containing protein n=1 Tax=Thiohalophilus sp. TaxID=3028392 RepID=UPI003A0FFCF2
MKLKCLTCGKTVSKSYDVDPVNGDLLGRPWYIDENAKKGTEGLKSEQSGKVVKIKSLRPLFERKLVGIANYFGLPDNSRSLSRLYRHVVHSLYKWLNRRSQRHSYNWTGLKAVLNHYGIQPLRVWKRNHVVVDWY